MSHECNARKKRDYLEERSVTKMEAHQNLLSKHIHQTDSSIFQLHSAILEPKFFKLNQLSEGEACSSGSSPAFLVLWIGLAFAYYCT
jgi:hypothetical protein